MPLRIGATAACLASLTFVMGLNAETPDCAAVAHQPIANATVQSELITATKFQPEGGKEIAELPVFCRVQMTLTPSADSSIQVEVWLPLENWNGKLQGVGNGGYAGSLSYDGLAGAIRLHYAAVATDAGHKGGAEDATWALNHPEKITDFGHRAIHLMTVDAKQVLQSFYGVPVERAYFNACSDGGREALMEAQRYPEDYNGIIAGAPANYWTHLVSNAVSNSLAMMATDSSFIAPAKLPAIQEAAQKACDLNDGVKDGIIENPARCHFDTSVLACKGADSQICLMPDQLTALNKLYAGGHLANGKLFFPGYPAGGEAAKGNWDVWITGDAPGHGAMYAYGTQFFKNMIYNDPNWDIHSFQADREVKAADEKMSEALNSTNPDLHAFIARGGKLILYHGWDDAAIAAPNTIHYFEAVRKKLGQAQTDKSVKLFMVPGMQHCFGGNGAFSFGQFGAGSGGADSDISTALREWVEHGIKPERVVASKPGTAITHPLCAYPNVARYDGKGDQTVAASYRCAPDTSQ